MPAGAHHAEDAEQPITMGEKNVSNAIGGVAMVVRGELYTSVDRACSAIYPYILGEGRYVGAAVRVEVRDLIPNHAVHAGKHRNASPNAAVIAGPGWPPPIRSPWRLDLDDREHTDHDGDRERHEAEPRERGRQPAVRE